MVMPFLRAASRANERQGVLCDHQFFIGGDDPDRCAAVWSGNLGAAGGIGRRVEFHAEPGVLGADRRAHWGRVLADAGGEHQGVRAAEHGRVGADVLLVTA